MPKKERPLTEKQQAMVEMLRRKHSKEKPFLPRSAVDQRIADSLDFRGLLNGDLVLAQADFQKGTRTYKRAVWLKESAD